MSKKFINQKVFRKQQQQFSSFSFVPRHDKVDQSQVDVLQDFVDDATNLIAITGAGISTESGIPDYRSEGVGLYNKNDYKPMNYGVFVKSHAARQRYWARSFIAWNHMKNLRPSTGHLVLTNWERAGKLQAVVTQNVDRLHHQAGTESVIELHGNLYTVRCLNCNHKTPRHLFQAELMAMNEVKDENVLRLMNNENYYQLLATPDGSVEIGEEFEHNFQIPYCRRCNGILKPDIIFFGDNVDSKLVKQIYDLVEQCSHVLVLGSSLQVFSSYRFVLHAHQRSKSIMFVNIGPTRADSLSDVSFLNAKIGDILSRIDVEKE